MRDRCDQKSAETRLNWTLLATPGEGLSGRYLSARRGQALRKIPGVTDRDYYNNSFHVPVYYPINAFKKNPA